MPFGIPLQNALAQRAQPQPAGNDEAAWQADAAARQDQDPRSKFRQVMSRLNGNPQPQPGGGYASPNGGMGFQAIMHRLAGQPQQPQTMQPMQPMQAGQPMPVRPQMMQPGMAMAPPQQPQMQMPPQNALMQRAQGMMY